MPTAILYLGLIGNLNRAWPILKVTPKQFWCLVSKRHICKPPPIEGI